MGYRCLGYEPKPKLKEEMKMRKVISKIIVILFMASIVMFTTTSVKPSPYTYTVLDYDAAIIKVANWILRHQAVDGAFDAECSWGDCSYGTGYTDIYDYNVLGRIGNTLLDAYELTGDTYYLDGDATHPNVGAKKTADLLMTLHWATDLPVGCHWWTAGVKGRWRSDDYLFMLRYAAISGDTSYSTKAHAEWESFKTECDNFQGPAPINPDTWINIDLGGGVDPSYAMYNIPAYVYAAYVLGDTTWANNAAVACTTAGDSPDLVEMLNAVTTGDPGLAGTLLFALQKLNPPAYAADITALTNWLKATQKPDGSWSDAGGYAYQDTAWAIKGLAAVEEWEATIAGADYLVSTQTIDSGIYKTGGCWYSSVYGYMVWIDAEDAQGLAQLSFNPIFRLDDLKTEISGLPDDAFKYPRWAEWWKRSLCKKVDVVIKQVEAEAYMGAINKLEHDIKGEIEKWIVDSYKATLIAKVNLIIRILPKSNITVTSPNGYETWNAGTPNNITWTSANVTGKVNIGISRDGGSTWRTIFCLTDNDGSQSWTVTGPATDQARVKVSSVINPAISDISDEDFTINVPTPKITVTSPNVYETWNIGKTYNITWTSANVTGKVNIAISRDGGTTWTTIFYSTPNDGSQSWRVTRPATTQARIKVSSVINPAIFDISDADFTIKK
jgi:hypothetical protein